jgi:hypothetical protein
MGSSTSTTLWASTACYRDSFIILYRYQNILTKFRMCQQISVQLRSVRFRNNPFYGSRDVTYGKADKSKGGRIPTASRQDSRHETKDAVLLHSWFVSMKLTSASWLRPVCGGVHNLIHFNCAPFFASCRRYPVLTVIYLDACRCAAYLTDAFLQHSVPNVPEHSNRDIIITQIL